MFGKLRYPPEMEITESTEDIAETIGIAFNRHGNRRKGLKSKMLELRQLEAQLFAHLSIHSSLHLLLCLLDFLSLRESWASWSFEKLSQIW